MSGGFCKHKKPIKNQNTYKKIINNNIYKFELPSLISSTPIEEETTSLQPLIHKRNTEGKKPITSNIKIKINKNMRT